MSKPNIGQLYDELHGYLITLIKGRLFEGCPEDYIYECLNDVFLIAIRKEDDPKFQENPKQWLVQTAKNVVDNFNRKYTNRLRFHQEDFDVDRIPQTKDMLEDLAFKMAIEDRILDKIKADLTLEERVIFVMRFEEYKTAERIAEELYMRKGAVSTRISRIKRKVTRLVKKYAGDSET